MDRLASLVPCPLQSGRSRDRNDEVGECAADIDAEGVRLVQWSVLEGKFFAVWEWGLRHVECHCDNRVVAAQGD